MLEAELLIICVAGYDEFDWLRYRGPTPSWDTGPDVDHTTGDSSGTDSDLSFNLSLLNTIKL